MKIELGVEDIEPNHWIAYAFDWPGCFSSAPTLEGAVAQAPARLIEHNGWQRKNCPYQIR